jgi:hypothetical protein
MSVTYCVIDNDKFVAPYEFDAEIKDADGNILYESFAIDGNKNNKKQINRRRFICTPNDYKNAKFNDLFDFTNDKTNVKTTCFPSNSKGMVFHIGPTMFKGVDYDKYHIEEQIGTNIFGTRNNPLSVHDMNMGVHLKNIKLLLQEQERDAYINENTHETFKANTHEQIRDVYARRRNAAINIVSDYTKFYGMTMSLRDMYPSNFSFYSPCYTALTFSAFAECVDVTKKINNKSTSILQGFEILGEYSHSLLACCNDLLKLDETVLEENSDIESFKKLGNLNTLIENNNIDKVRDLLTLLLCKLKLTYNGTNYDLKVVDNDGNDSNMEIYKYSLQYRWFQCLPRETFRDYLLSNYINEKLGLKDVKLAQTLYGLSVKYINKYTTIIQETDFGFETLKIYLCDNADDIIKLLNMQLFMIVFKCYISGTNDTEIIKPILTNSVSTILTAINPSLTSLESLAKTDITGSNVLDGIFAELDDDIDELIGQLKAYLTLYAPDFIETIENYTILKQLPETIIQLSILLNTQNLGINDDLKTKDENDKYIFNKTLYEEKYNLIKSWNDDVTLDETTHKYENLIYSKQADFIEEDIKVLKIAAKHYFEDLTCAPFKEVLIKTHSLPSIRQAFIQSLIDYNERNKRYPEKIILGGFSQGGELSVLLMSELMDTSSPKKFITNYINMFDESYQFKLNTLTKMPFITDMETSEKLLNYLYDIHKKIVCDIELGWRFTRDMAIDLGLNHAKNEFDTGVVISINSEQSNVDVGHSTIIQEHDRNHRYVHSINPLNWSTCCCKPIMSRNSIKIFKMDNDRKYKFMDTGDKFSAYIGQEGVLKITIHKSGSHSYTIMTDGDNDVFRDGVLHYYDQFLFYDQLKQNILTRIENMN